MIKIILSHIRNHLGFSKSEANGLLLLLPTMFLLIWLLHLYKNHLIKDTQYIQNEEELALWKQELDDKLKITPNNEEHNEDFKTAHAFKFNPNYVTKEDIVKLGFSEKTAHNWTKFLKANGKIRSAEDLKKIYGISTKRVDQLLAYIEIPQKKEAPTQVKKEANEPLITDLNAVTAEELMKVRGIGTVLSKRIIKFRDKLGGFHHLDQLDEVYGLKADVLDELKTNYFVDTSIKKLNINSDSIKYLATHPYISYNQAKVIINYRKQHGNYASVEDLNKIQILNDSIINKVGPYLKFD